MQFFLQGENEFWKLLQITPRKAPKCKSTEVSS